VTANHINTSTNTNGEELKKGIILKCKNPGTEKFSILQELKRYSSNFTSASNDEIAYNF
jgi:hypothetical protein